MKTAFRSGHIVPIALAVLVGGCLSAQAQNTFPASGNVGIGTTAPATNLVVVGTGMPVLSVYRDVSGVNTMHSSALFLTRTSGDMVDGFGGGLYFGGSDATASGLFASVGGIRDGADNTGALTLRTMVAGTVFERMRISSSGNVGIGTLSPSAALHVNGYTKLSGTMYVTDLGNRTSPYVDTGDAILRTQGVFINPAKLGNNNMFVGGGLVWDNTDVRWEYATSQAATYSGFILFDGTNGGLRIATTATSGANGQVAAPVEHFTISASGNVGIGITNPSNKLEVNGTIRAKEVIVETTGWSDYVFASDYKLAPLSEVKAHIAAEGHLPGIPSAAEVAKHGIGVGDMQAKLLAKLEEMTLHLITLSEKLDAQSAEIDALKSENAALRR